MWVGRQVTVLKISCFVYLMWICPTPTVRWVTGSVSCQQSGDDVLRAGTYYAQAGRPWRGKGGTLEGQLCSLTPSRGLDVWDDMGPHLASLKSSHHGQAPTESSPPAS